MTSQSSLPIRFSGWKKRLSLFIAFSLLLSAVLLLSPPGHAQAASLNAAVSYANSHWRWTYYDHSAHLTCSGSTCKYLTDTNSGWTQPDFECAEFVARSLAAAGLIPGLSPSSPPSAYDPYTGPNGKTYDLLWVGYAAPYDGVKQYLLDNGLATDIGNNPSAASAGDIVIYPGGDGTGHTSILVSMNGSNSLVDAHNNAAYQANYLMYPNYTHILHINAYYRIVNYNSGKCLDVANYGTSNGDNVQQWNCHSPSTTNQLWIAVPTNKTWSGYPVDQIVEFGTDECLDASGWGTGNGTNVDIWQCGSSMQNNQLWIVQSTSWNTYIWNYGATVARGIHVNLDVVCTSATNYGQSNGANVQLWQDAPNSACSGHNQIWTFENPY